MTTEERVIELGKKIDIILHILGHDRTKSHAELQREAEADIMKWRMKDELKKKKRREATS